MYIHLSEGEFDITRTVSPLHNIKCTYTLSCVVKGITHYKNHSHSLNSHTHINTHNTHMNKTFYLR